MPVLFSSRRRHTRWPRDWSSDVCSSDLSGTYNLVERTELELIWPQMGSLTLAFAMRITICSTQFIYRNKGTIFRESAASILISISSLHSQQVPLPHSTLCKIVYKISRRNCLL